jgi:GDPmannose 4,6-dehydratase
MKGLIMKKRRALITGATGQDAAYLADFLLGKDYKVYGTFRRTSTRNFERLEHLGILNEIELIPLDLLDQSSIVYALRTTRPDEVYNLAAQSFVGASFEQPIATGEITGLGAVRVLDAIISSDLRPKFYQATTSELFGNGEKRCAQSEQTPFRPRSPYAAAKLYAHWVTVTYREAYRLFACSGILFNHESPLRGIEFVTRKITDGVARIRLGLQERLHLGNVNAYRDWGYAGDYVRAMWLMLQQEWPDDYVIATGEAHSVMEFAEIAFSTAGLRAQGYIEIDESLFRPTDTDYLLGDPSKAVRGLGWNPKATPFKELIRIMVEADLKRVEKEIQAGVHARGYQGPVILSPHRE